MVEPAQDGFQKGPTARIAGPSALLGKVNESDHDPVEIDRDGLEVLDREECMRLLATATLGRIALTSGALPTVLPVNFALDGDRIVIRTGRGSKLDAATRDAVVAFEVDELEPTWRSGWSLVVTGVAREVTHPDEVARLSSLLGRRWPARGDERLITIPVELISGRRLVTTPTTKAGSR